VITIIIPAYNAGPYIQETLESALQQSGAVREVILVDDGSPDDTSARIEPYRSRVRCLRQENQGVSAARNLGAQQAKTDWLLFLDADDRLFPGALTPVVNGLKESDGVVFGNVRDLGGDGGGIRGAHFREGAPPAGALGCFWKSFIITPGAALVRRDVHHAIGGFKPFQPVEDRMYWMQAGMVANFRHVNVDMVEKRDVPTSASADRAKGLVSGFLAQIAFLDWCREQGHPLAGFECDPARLLEHSLRKARRYHSLEGVDRLLEEGRRLQLSSGAIRWSACLRHWDRLLSRTGRKTAGNRSAR
jgi:hypothetical protein